MMPAFVLANSTEPRQKKKNACFDGETEDQPEDSNDQLASISDATAVFMAQRCHQEGFSSKPSNFGPDKWVHFILNQLPQ